MTWQIIKESYIKDHLAKRYLKQPERRLRALDATEALLRSQHPEYIDDPMRIYRFDIISKFNSNLFKLHHIRQLDKIIV